MSGHDLSEQVGRVTAAYDRASDRDTSTLTRVEGAPVPPGFTMWRLGEDGPATVVPALVQDAPLDMRVRLMARVRANVTGTCPLCHEAVGLVLPGGATPTARPAAWASLPVTLGIMHQPTCEALFDEEDRHWFDPRAVAAHGGPEAGR